MHSEHRASVWILEGNKLIQKRIVTGLNNNTEVQVLEGLGPEEMVVTGQSGGEHTKASGSSSSPFMPQRRGRGRPSGGQRGGGGGPR